MRGIGRAGVLGDERLEVGLEKAAINAVMAGCRTEYFPVVVAALEAMFDEAFNLHTVLTSTGGAPLSAIVSGPIAQESRPFGSIVATRSPGAMPSCLSAPATCAAPRAS